MFNKMVVLLDGSELAEVVFDYAQELSGRLHIETELLHVASPNEEDQLPMRRAYIERMAEELCARAELVRAKYDKDQGAQCIQAHCRVVVGSPADEILKYVDENDIDLVMMSTHGRSGASQWDLGSVANKVIHACRCPVWLVPTELREEIISDSLPRRPLVVPLSGSKMSEAVIPFAVAIMKQRAAESELVLLWAEDITPMVVSRAALQEKEDERVRMKAYLEALADPIRSLGIPVRTEVLVGDPAASIIEYLRANPAQLLAMATRGRTGLSRMIFGSVAENVVHLVKKTPLLLVSGRDGD